MLVDYSDSDSENSEPAHDQPLAADIRYKRKRDSVDGSSERAAVRVRPPPLPASFRSLYATNVRTSTSDDPALHGGRRRQVPHVEGNWPSHVYLEWLPTKVELQRLDQIIDAASSRHSPASKDNTTHSMVHSFLRSDLGAQLPLHVSISAPLVLNTQAKDNFLSSLRNALKDARISTFLANVVDVDWVANHDKSRFFLILRLSEPAGNELSQLLDVCNHICHAYDLPQLYQSSNLVGVAQAVPTTQATAGSPSLNAGTGAFHVSIAWTLEEPSEMLKRVTHRMALEDLNRLPIQFSEVKVKVGNIVTDIGLRDV